VGIKRRKTKCRKRYSLLQDSRAIFCKLKEKKDEKNAKQEGEDRRVRKKKRMDKMKREKGKLKRVWIRSEGTKKKEKKRK
jgi:hypothetical protein